MEGPSTQEMKNPKPIRAWGSRLGPFVYSVAGLLATPCQCEKADSDDHERRRLRGDVLIFADEERGARIEGDVPLPCEGAVAACGSAAVRKRCGSAIVE